MTSDSPLSKPRPSWIRRGAFLARLPTRRAAVALLLVTLLSINPLPASACGWWGDGDSEEDDAVAIGADGRPAPDAKPPSGRVDSGTGGHVSGPGGFRGIEVPAPRSGYGMVIQRDGGAVPYLDAVKGRPVYSIQQLRHLGFLAVIDLGTGPTVAALHRRETEALDMKYFNIPIDGDVPSPAQASRFQAVLSARENLPILVFSASAEMLGGMWASYLLAEGSTQERALGEGREFGLSAKGASDLEMRRGE